MRFTKEHEWITLNIEESVATIGITDFAQHELGDIVFVETASISTHIKKDDVFGTIEAVKTVSDLFLPISGTILATNYELNNDPSLLNSDPYTNWIVKIKYDDVLEYDTLLEESAYNELIGK